MRKPETIRFWRGRLPHWEVQDGLYFVTIHQAGAVPTAALSKIRAKVALVDTCDAAGFLQAQRMVFQNIEDYLENAPVVTDLADPIAAKIVTDAIDHYQQLQRWQMRAYVVMPNHVHLFFTTGTPLKKLLESFKQWTGVKIRESQGRHGRFWQREWFDHWSRSTEQDERIIRYIRNNPMKAGLVKQACDWPYLRTPPKQ